MRVFSSPAALVAVLVLGAATAASASASTWTVSQLGAGPTNAALYGVACPSASLCVAVGGNNTIAASTNPTGGATAWSVGHPGGSFEAPPGLPGPSGESVFGGAQIRGVSCPSSELCVAASFQGNFYSSTSPAGDPSAWKFVEQSSTGPNFHMTGISCPSPALCVAVAYAGNILVSTDPTGPSASWPVTKLPQRVDFRAVSCPSVSLCVATGNEGNIVVSTDPTGGPSAWKSVGAPAGESALDGISCPSPALCVTGNAGQILTSTDPAVPGSWKAQPAGTGLPVTGLSCPLISACVAVDNNSDVIVSTDPTGGQEAWSFENVLPYGFTGKDGEFRGNGMFGISCPTTSLCVAVGQRFQAMTSTDPFAREKVKAPIRGKSKLPRAVITRHPAKRLDHRKGGVKVAFRFRSLGKAAGFECKLDRRRFRSCKSPRRYRLGGGKHVFRVRAVAASGAHGPRASFHFRVGKLTERDTAGSCKQGQDSSFGKPCVDSA